MQKKKKQKGKINKNKNNTFYLVTAAFLEPSIMLLQRFNFWKHHSMGPTPLKDKIFEF